MIIRTSRGRSHSVTNPTLPPLFPASSLTSLRNFIRPYSVCSATTAVNFSPLRCVTYLLVTGPRFDSHALTLRRRTGRPSASSGLPTIYYASSSSMPNSHPRSGSKHFTRPPTFSTDALVLPLTLSHRTTSFSGTILPMTTCVCSVAFVFPTLLQPRRTNSRPAHPAVFLSGTPWSTKATDALISPPARLLSPGTLLLTNKFFLISL